jgi:hypothetical protein
VGSTLTGKNIAVTSTQGDLDITGSSLSGTNIALNAAQNLNLSAAQNTTATQTTSSASSTSFGVSLAVGVQPIAPKNAPNANMGLPTFSLSTSSSNSSSTANATQQVNTVVNASGNLSVNAGGNATLNGARIYGNTVTGSIAGNLNLTSLQDTSTYNSSSSSTGVDLGLTGNVPSLSLSVSNGKLNSSWDSVTNQTGIYAGTGGFNIDVGGNTNLTGSVISSTANPALNSLSTGTLTYGNLTNTSSYSGQNSNLGIAFSPGAGYKGFTASPPSAVNAQGNATSTTASGISPATISITNAPEQKAISGQTVTQTIAGINTDTTAGPNTLAQPNITAIQQDMEAAGLVGSEVNQLVQYEASKNPSKWGNGETDNQIATAVVGAITGNATGSLGAIAQATVGNFVEAQLSGELGKIAQNGGPTDGSPGNIGLHAIASCASALIGGQDCQSSAVGAGVAAAATNLFPNAATLNPVQSQNVENIIDTIAGGAGLATGSGNLANTIIAAQTTTDNNYLYTAKMVRTLVTTIQSPNCGVTCFFGALQTFTNQSGQNDIQFIAGVLQGLFGSVVNVVDLVRYAGDITLNTAVNNYGGPSCTVDCAFYNSVNTAISNVLANIRSLPASVLTSALGAVTQDAATLNNGSPAQINALGQQVGGVLGSLATEKGLGKAAEVAADAINAAANATPKGVNGVQSTYTIGSSDGGPGQWTAAYEGLSQAESAYQQQVTGAPAGTVYNVANPGTSSGTTSFDGYDPATNTLLDAKLWNNWPISTTFSTDSVLKQAEAQIKAAGGANIEWVVPSAATANAIEEIFRTQRIGIVVKVLPPTP